LPNASGKIVCPFHEDTDPSLHVYDETGWSCFGCGRGGTIIDLGAAMWNIEPRGKGYHEIRRRLQVTLGAWSFNMNDEAARERVRETLRQLEEEDRRTGAGAPFSEWWAPRPVAEWKAKPIRWLWLPYLPLAGRPSSAAARGSARAWSSAGSRRR